MYIKKVIETAIDLDNSINFAPDIRDNLMYLLEDKYAKKCFQGCYVLRILDIIRYSEINIIKNTYSAKGQIYVTFEIEGVAYIPGEIVNGCEVVSKSNDGLIVCKTNESAIYLNAGKTFSSIVVGQFISVRVVRPVYANGETQISINATPFTYIQNPYYYYLEGDNKPYEITDFAYFADILRRINDELIKQKDTNKDGIKFMRDRILYAYQNAQTKPKNALEFNLLSLFAQHVENSDLTELIAYIASIKSDTKLLLPCYMIRDSKIDLTTPMSYIYKDLPTDAVPKMGYKTEDVIMIQLEEFLTYLKSAREMTEIYNTKEILAKHNNLWLIYKKAKLN